MSVHPIRILIAVCLWVLLSAIITSVYFWQWVNKDIPTGLESYEIKRGASLYRVASDLNEKGFIQWPRVWVLYARTFGFTQIKAGEYNIEATASPADLLIQFNQGKVVQYQITFVEGQRFSDILNTLQKTEKIKKTLNGANLTSALEKNGIKVDHPEGWFYPDTFQYSQGDSDISLLVRSYKRMQSVLAEEWANRAGGLPYESAYEALIMASIVEKETGAAHERKEIAGVFVRRLNKKMRLQTDPTVIYGMGDSYDGNIRRKDLRTPTPYNTYVIKGLPPTPIALPGRAAINAALHPADGDSLYFVAKGDGTHYFSSTLEEHNRAVNQYQKRRRENYRSSPAQQ